jgi:hypothetical protein
MNLFRPRVWSAINIGLLKWSCILIGMIAGAYLADFTKRYVWLIALTAILLAVKPAVSYLRSGRA